MSARLSPENIMSAFSNGSTLTNYSMISFKESRQGLHPLRGRAFAGISNTEISVPSHA
jgi:hypothetical protein